MDVRAFNREAWNRDVDAGDRWTIAINGTLAGNTYGFIIGNLAEVFFMICLLAGERALGIAGRPVRDRRP